MDGRENLRREPDDASLAADVRFLAEEFDITPRDAARLVSSEPETVERLAEAELRRQRNIDPLDDVPAPHPKYADYFPAPAFESAPVLATENKRTGAG